MRGTGVGVGVFDTYNAFWHWCMAFVLSSAKFLSGKKESRE